jgi:homospermidine synthase
MRALLLTSSTTLQVAAPVVAGMLLRICLRYLGEVVGVRSDWTPLAARERLFDEPIDRSDPWQFVNFRMA